MYVWWQNKRLSAAEAIRHPYLSEGRLRYHTCMCSCCLHMPSGAIITAPDLDPTCAEPFKPHFEDDLVSSSAVRGKFMFSCSMLATVMVKGGWSGVLLTSEGSLFHVTIYSSGNWTFDCSFSDCLVVML